MYKLLSGATKSSDGSPHWFWLWLGAVRQVQDYSGIVLNIAIFLTSYPPSLVIGIGRRTFTQCKGNKLTEYEELVGINLMGTDNHDTSNHNDFVLKSRWYSIKSLLSHDRIDISNLLDIYGGGEDCIHNQYTM